jgi:hypothetical protein
MEGDTMRKTLAIVAAVSLVACTRTQESGGEVDTVADTSRLSVPDIDVGLKTDTVTVPTLGIEKDTVVISKPVKTGEKQYEVKRPTVDVKRP